jgi:hypothetical protein
MPPASEVSEELVDRIARRYEAYASFTAAQGRPVMSLDEWFRWYAIENADQFQADAVTPSSCSVTTQAVGVAAPERWRPVLDALRRRLG